MITPELLIWLAIVCLSTSVAFFISERGERNQPVVIRRNRVREITPTLRYTRTTSRLAGRR